VGLGLPCIFIRYNPDTYQHNEHVERLKTQFRYDTLIQTIQSYLNIDTTTFFTSNVYKHYLFYNTTGFENKYHKMEYLDLQVLLS
jgi:hypothetical protein